MSRIPAADRLVRTDSDIPRRSGLFEWINRHADRHPVLTVCGDVLACGVVGFVIGTIGYGRWSESQGIVLGSVLGFFGLLTGLAAVRRAGRNRS
jgi:hypothetical protein